MSTPPTARVVLLVSAPGALFSIGTQPSETGSTFPDNAALTELARQAGAAGGVAACITSGTYPGLVAIVRPR